MNRFLPAVLLAWLASGLLISPVVAEAHGARRARSYDEASTHAQVRQAQMRLRAVGYDPGPIDGHLGPRTRAALRAYQRAHGLPRTGTLDRATAHALLAGR
jgi:peptidoglycan hydrolase-like protein with peptidoglycan-binding domain